MPLLNLSSRSYSSVLRTILVVNRQGLIPVEIAPADNKNEAYP